MTLEIGATYGRYRIRAILGEGATATVYEAYQPNLDRVLALKVLRPALTADPAFVTRFGFEARALARLDHPGIVRVYDAEEIEGAYTIAMQYVDGGTLHGRIGALAHPMAPEQVVALVSALANALEYAHEFGVIHRDIKPSNILLSRDGRPLLTDFGIAKLLAATDQTRIGSGVGTPEYMSPEQVMGQEATSRTDTYALAVVAYELVTGRVPFSGDPLAVMHAQAYDAAPARSSLNPALPLAVDEVFAIALAKDPGQRFASAIAFGRALASRLSGVRTLTPDLPIPAPPIAAAPIDTVARPVMARAPRGRGIWFAVAGASAIALVLAVGGLVYAQGGVDATVYSVGRLTNLMTPSPSPVTAVHVAARLTDWITEWNRVTASARDDDVLKLPLDSWTEVTALASAARQPIPSDVTRSITDLQVASGTAAAATPATAAYYDALHDQRVKAVAAATQLRALKVAYSTIPVANAAPIPARKVFVTSKDASPQLGDFPLTGYNMTLDQVLSSGSVRREFRPVTRATTDYFWVALDTLVAAPTSANAPLACSWSGTETPLSTSEVSLDPVGDTSRACKYVFSTSRVFTLSVRTRNVYLFVQDNPPSALTDQTAVNMLAVFARSEIARIDRLAPR